MPVMKCDHAAMLLESEHSNWWSVLLMDTESLMEMAR